MFRLEFKTDNAAFHEGYGREETARILNEIAQKVIEGINSGKIKDINGNTIGWWNAN